MRRLLSLLLLALTVFSMVSPAMLAPAGTELPACCRKNGKHHCGMAARPGAPADGAVLNASGKCPLFPSGTIATAPAFIAPAARVQLRGVNLFAGAARLPQVEARARLSSARGWQKRGPPSLLP